MRQEFFEILMNKYLHGTASAEERKMVEEYLDRMAAKYPENLDKDQVDAVTADIYQRLSQQIAAEKVPVVSMRRSIVRIVAAAAVIILIGTGIWYFTQNVPVSKSSVATTDVLPGATSATLTLADGRKIILDSAAEGLLAVEGGININSENGTINYSGGTAADDLYNTLTTRRGEQYSALKLSDGTKVWLNAGSSIHFPVAFNGKERKVEISGEVYFEVAKDASKPFKVTLQRVSSSPAGGSGREAAEGGPEILVLGTCFNINAYSDEPSIKTTLIEGSVKISANNKELKLIPGSQAELKLGNLILNKDIDTEEIIAWKDGLFQFESADMRQVLRQLSRWYDVDIIVEPDVPSRKFFGSITRNNSLNSVLKILSASDVHYKLEGKKLIVTK